MSTIPTYKSIQLIEPEFDSLITDLIIELDHLRKKRLFGTTHPRIFFQLKHIFHTLESIGSARIEGNRTTIAEFIETKIDSQQVKNQSIIEIQNVEESLQFIDENISNININRFFISELHKKIVNNLPPPPEGEGDLTPGTYRNSNVTITHSSHIPPDYTLVNDLMEELFIFINTEHPSKYDLLKIALAHHRFVWIHPFRNGNGRSVRLFTYALLVKFGFNIERAGRIINPTAVFCNDRDKYYNFLSKADSGNKFDLLDWCFYVLSGLKTEIEKVDNLLNYDFLKKEILSPALNFSLKRKFINDKEFKILKKALDSRNQELKASDLKSIFPDKISASISRDINDLKKKKMLVPVKENSRKYVISFSNNFLLRGFINSLGEKGFLPIQD